MKYTITHTHMAIKCQKNTEKYTITSDVIIVFEAINVRIVRFILWDGYLYEVIP